MFLLTQTTEGFTTILLIKQKCETEVILWCERGCVRDKGAMPAAESGTP